MKVTVKVGRFGLGETVRTHEEGGIGDPIVFDPREAGIGLDALPQSISTNYLSEVVLADLCQVGPTDFQGEVTQLSPQAGIPTPAVPLSNIGDQIPPGGRVQAGDDIAPSISDRETDKSDGEADISDRGADISGNESILSVDESIFSAGASQSSATSIGQVPPDAREQAEDAIARALAKNSGVSIIVAKGLDKLGSQKVERLMVKSLRQFSSDVKRSLSKDELLLRDSFSFLEHRAGSIARNIRELTQPKIGANAISNNSAIKKYLEEMHYVKVSFSQRIGSWPEYIDGEELNNLNEADEDEELGESSEIKPSYQPEEPISLGESLLQQITEYLASDKVASDFLSAVKDNFIKVQSFTLRWRGEMADVETNR